MVPRYNREGYEFTRNEFKKVIKRLSDAYRQVMKENNLKIDITNELARVHPIFTTGIDNLTVREYEELEKDIAMRWFTQYGVIRDEDLEFGPTEVEKDLLKFIDKKNDFKKIIEASIKRDEAKYKQWQD